MELSVDKLLFDAYKNKYAVPAINVSNMETVYGALEASYNKRSPIILQIAPSQLDCHKISFEDILVIIRQIAKKFPHCKYGIHLDHCESVAECKEALDAGFPSVMYDGSKEEYETNVYNTRIIKEYAKDRTVEAELGKIDGDEGARFSENNGALTDPKLLLDFIERTNADAVAVSIGNAHGFYKSNPKIHFDLLDQMYESSNCPLVLHGASGISERDIKAAIGRGISKINYYTQVDYAFMEKLIESKNLTMMEAMAAAQEAFKNNVEAIISMCESEGRND